jgi:hypothetical protein
MSNPETRKVLLAERRAYARRRRELATEEQAERARAKHRVSSAKWRAAQKEAREAAKRAEEAKQEAARKARERALLLASQLPKAKVKSEVEILHEAAAKRARLARLRSGESYRVSQYVKHWSERLRV